MASVFLSYARDDVARVRPLAQALESAGHSVWWDQHIAGGQQYAEEIEQALESADAVVVMWTDSSCRSSWVRDEAASARDRGRLIPVCLDGCTPPLGFRQFQAIDLRGWNGRSNSKALEPLKHAVSALAGTGAATRSVRKRPAPPPPPRPPAQWLREPKFIAAAAALLLVAAALILPRLGLLASGGSVSPRVALGEFAVTSADLPRGMSRAMHDEIMAAFGTENAVTLTTAAGVAGSSAAPFLLDGSIRKDADALRFTVSLKDTDSGTVLWSRAFDRSAADPLATRQVAEASSQIVRCGLWGAASYPRRMPEDALTLYLNYCDEHWGGSPDDKRMVDTARRVTVALPDFSFGWSALALAAAPLAQAADPEAAAIRKEALQAARKATKLDDHNPEGYMAEAWLLPTERFAEREALLRKAISVRPTECGCERSAYGDFLTSVGRLEEAVEQYQRAHALLPLSPTVSVRLAHALFLSGRHDEGQRLVKQMLGVWPDAALLRLVELKSAFWTRQYDRGLEMLGDPGLHLTSAQIEALTAAFLALRSNDPAARSAAAGRLRSIAADPRRNDRMVVAALAALGDDSAAVDAAQRLIRARGPMLSDVLFDPNLAEGSRTPHYQRLVSELGLASYWRSTKNLPDICHEDSKPGFCAVA